MSKTSPTVVELVEMLPQAVDLGRVREQAGGLAVGQRWQVVKQIPTQVAYEARLWMAEIVYTAVAHYTAQHGDADAVQLAAEELGITPTRVRDLLRIHEQRLEALSPDRIDIRAMAAINAGAWPGHQISWDAIRRAERKRLLTVSHGDAVILTEDGARHLLAEGHTLRHPYDEWWGPQGERLPEPPTVALGAEMTRRQARAAARAGTGLLRANDASGVVIATRDRRTWLAATADMASWPGGQRAEAMSTAADLLAEHGWGVPRPVDRWVDFAGDQLGLLEVTPPAAEK